MHRRMGSGERYVGEYLPGKQELGALIGGCSDGFPFIILSGEYMAKNCPTWSVKRVLSQGNYLHAVIMHNCILCSLAALAARGGTAVYSNFGAHALTLPLPSIQRPFHELKTYRLYMWGMKGGVAEL